MDSCNGIRVSLDNGIECERNRASVDASAGWAKFMEWKYPVEVVVTSPGIFKAAGAIEAAASL